MNTANLQLEGLCMAVASLAELLKAKGLASTAEIDAALAEAERTALSRRPELPPANMEAVGFPVRLLRLANRTSVEGVPLTFTELTRLVGEEKDERDGPGKRRDA